MTETPPFAINQFTSMKQSFDDDVALYSRLDVRQVEVSERKLDEDFDAARRQLERFHDAGLQPTSVQPRVHALYPDRMAEKPGSPDERMARLRQTIDLFTDAFPNTHLPFVTIGGRAPQHNFREAHRTARKQYRELAAYAEDKGARIAFETLHPVLMNVDSFICTLNDALDLVEAVDHPAFGLTVDIWHLWQEIDIYDRVAALGDRIFIVHFADWPRAGVRHTDDRLIPGDGCIDLPAFISAVNRADYEGPWALEILSNEKLPDSLWKADYAEVIRRSRDAFDSAWQEAEMLSVVSGPLLRSRGGVGGL